MSTPPLNMPPAPLERGGGVVRTPTVQEGSGKCDGSNYLLISPEVSRADPLPAVDSREDKKIAGRAGPARSGNGQRKNLTRAAPGLKC